MHALGRLFDIGLAWAPVDLNTADGATGKRIAMGGASGITFVATIGVAAGGTDDVVFTVKQHTASVSGTSNNLATATVSTSTGVTRFHIKSEATLDNDESWVTTTQSDLATVTLTGATYASLQKLVVIEIDADQLGDTYTHLSVDVGVASLANAELGAGLYILHGLRYQRKPANLWNLLSPGSANV